MVLRAPNQLVYEDVPEPLVGPRDVLIQIKACGICGSDVHGMDGSSGRRIPPIIMGHEAAGVVIATGREVAGWQPGDRVTFDSTVYCGTCHFCRRGLINLCDNRRVFGVSTPDYRLHGAMAEYVAVPEHVVYRLPDAVTFVQAALVEPMSVALHAVARLPVHVNASAVVIGSGPIGLLASQCLRAAGCGLIYAVDLDAGRLQLACQLGADRGLHPERDDVVQQVLRGTHARGVDIALDAVGIAATLNLAVRCLIKGGALAVVGTYAHQPELLLQEVVYRQLTLIGSVASCGDYPACLNLIARHRVNVDALISAVAPLAEGAAWFERLRASHGESLVKVVLEP